MAGILAPVATQVGLQLILQPFSNTVGELGWCGTPRSAPTQQCATSPDPAAATPRSPASPPRPNQPPRCCSTAVGVLYPAYASFKAVEVLRLRNDDSEAAKWLTYWAVYGAFSTVERLLERLLPWRVPPPAAARLAGGWPLCRTLHSAFSSAEPNTGLLVAAGAPLWPRPAPALTASTCLPSPAARRPQGAVLQHRQAGAPALAAAPPLPGRAPPVLAVCAPLPALGAPPHRRRAGLAAFVLGAHCFLPRTAEKTRRAGRWTPGAPPAPCPGRPAPAPLPLRLAPRPRAASASLRRCCPRRCGPRCWPRRRRSTRRCRGCRCSSGLCAGQTGDRWAAAGGGRGGRWSGGAD